MPVCHVTVSIHVTGVFASPCRAFLTCRVWLALLGTTAILTGPLVLAQNPVRTLQETASEAKDVRTVRGKLFLVLATFFFVEGLGILAYPTLAQRVSHQACQVCLKCKANPKKEQRYSYLQQHCLRCHGRICA